MNKDEILARSREENEGKADERELQIQANASEIGMIVGGLLSVIIIVFSQIADAPLAGLAVLAVYLSMVGSKQLFHFIKTRKKTSLLLGIIGMTAGLACLGGMIVLGLQ